MMSVLPVDYLTPDVAHAVPELAAPGGCAGGPSTVVGGRCLFPWRPVIADRCPSRGHRRRRVGGDALAFSRYSARRRACLIWSLTWAVPRDADTHHHATEPGGTHAYTEIVPGSRDRRPAASCGPVRRRH